MGLDQFAYKIKRATGPIASAVDFQNEINTETGDTRPEVERDQLHYWRKHPNLHGWMEALYRERGGTGDSFNCDPVMLTLEDLDRLEADVNGNNLPETSGFFFGSSTPEDKADDLTFIMKARAAINDGWQVLYDSWW